jgi:Acetyltransferase (GNAT) domain
VSDATPSLTASLLARCLENTCERRRRAARGLDGGLLAEGDGLLLTAVEALPWVTGATVTRTPREPAVTLERASRFFAARALDWDLTAAGEIAAAMAPTVEAAGFTLVERRPGMLMTPIAGQPPDVPGLVIREVKDAAALEAFVTTSAAGFGGGEELYRILYTEATLAEPGGTLYVGELDGIPVATAVRGTSYGIAGIGGVSTVPAARRRGIGAAITWRAALDGLAEGCDASFLEASEMGYGVYARMGYRHVVDFHVWNPPPPR